jgi:hypothetical protein
LDVAADDTQHRNVVGIDRLRDRFGRGGELGEQPAG